MTKKIQEYGSMGNRPRRERKRLVTDSDVSQLFRVVTFNKKRSLQDHTNIVNEGTDHKFSNKTIFRKLKLLDYKRRDEGSGETV